MHLNDNNGQGMDVDAPGPEDGTVSTARADPDGEVAGSDGSGSLGKIAHVLCPSQIPDVMDWGIPPESQRPCDPEVEVCAVVSFV